MEVAWVIEAPVVVEKKSPGYDEYAGYSEAAIAEFPVNPSYPGPMPKELSHSSST